MLNDNTKETKPKAVLKSKLSDLINHNSNETNTNRNLSLTNKTRGKPMVYLMNQTLKNQYQSILINKRRSRPLLILEDSMKISPLRLYTASATLTNQLKERDKFVFKWSRNRKPMAINGLSAKSTFMSINNTQRCSSNNCKLNTKSLNKSNEVSISKEYKSTEHVIGNKRQGIDDKTKKKLFGTNLFKNSFIAHKTKTKKKMKTKTKTKTMKNNEEANKSDVDSNVNLIKTNPNGLYYALNSYFQSIERNIIKEMNPNENMVKRYKLLRNDMRIQNDRVKDILDGLIRKQRDNDEYLEKKKYLYKNQKYNHIKLSNK